MSDINCPICNRYKPLHSTHQCPPMFEVLDPDYTGTDWSDAYKVYEHHHEQAAKAAAEQMDSSCGEGGHERTLHVRRAGETHVVIYKITFDYSIDYYANQVPHDAN